MLRTGICNGTEEETYVVESSDPESLAASSTEAQSRKATQVVSWPNHLPGYKLPVWSSHTRISTHRFAAQPPFSMHWLRNQRPSRVPPMMPKPGQPKWTFNGRPPVSPAAAVVAANLSSMAAAGGAAAMGAGLAPPPGGAAAMSSALYRNNSFNTAFSHRPGVIEVRKAPFRDNSREWIKIFKLHK